jgi:transposase
MKKPVFKQSHQHQIMLFPPSLDSMIAENHPVRVVNEVIDKIDISELLSTYKGGGSSSYHPGMLLKVMIYAYLKNIFSSRQIEEALQENIHFMWLSGMATPDHSTISAFRSKRLKGLFEDIFTQVVLLLAEEGLVDLKDIYTDGTKLEANANRYTFVWGKRIATEKEKIKENLAGFWAYVEELYKAEAEQPERPDFTEVSAENVEKTIKKINEVLTDKKVDPKIKKKLKTAEKYPDRLRAYAEKEEILAGRNSYSKTDQDATFMRMKDDHMKNGQLKPAYNVQFSTSNQIVVHYSTGQTTSDTVLYKAHLEGYKDRYGYYPDESTADAGYGSEENYSYLEEHGIEAYVKYSYFHKEQKKSFKKQIALPQNLYYNAEQDFYVCPMGQRMEKVSQTRKKTKTGFEQSIGIYEAKNCLGCPLRGICHKSKSNRRIQRNANLERLKAKAKTLLLCEKGIEKRGQRCVDVEGSFGQLKQNKGFRRFMLRGKEKIEIEIGLLAISMNLAKLAKHKARPMGEVCPESSKMPENQVNKGDIEQKRA